MALFGELVGRIESASRRMVWETPMEKSASAHDLFEDTLLGLLGADHRPTYYGLGVTRRHHEYVVEAYYGGNQPAAKVRGAIAKSLGLSQAEVFPMRCGGLEPQMMLSAGDAGGGAVLVANGGYGTIGGFAADLLGPYILAVSNNHVFVDRNQGAVGEPLYLRGGAKFGHLHRFNELVGRPGVNTLDAAVGTIHEGTVLRGPSVRGTRPPMLGLKVHKTGATTGRTSGTIVGVAATATLSYPGVGPTNFRRCIRIEGDGEPFSLPGDSGSLVLDYQNVLVGIIFAGETNGAFSLANPADILAETMGISFGG